MRSSKTAQLIFSALLALALICLPSCQTNAQAPTEEASFAPTLTFRSESKLQDHFEKHGDEVGCASTDEYVARANDVVHDPRALHKTQREDGDDAYFLEDTGEFVVVSEQGYLRTYFITDKGYFDRQ